MSEQLLDTRQTAQRLGISPEKLRRWRMQGRGPQWCRLDGFSVRYRASDLLEWEASRLVDRGPQKPVGTQQTTETNGTRPAEPTGDDNGDQEPPE